MFELLFKYPAGTFSRSELVFDPLIAPPVLFALGAALLIAGALVTARRRQRLGTGRLAVLYALQTAVIAVIGLALAQPALRLEALRSGENAIALLLDRSASMSYGAGSRRSDVAVEALDGGWLDALATDFGVRRYVFDGEASLVERFDREAATGTSTDVAGALLRVLADARETSLSGVIVATDGADNASGLAPPALDEIRAYGVPVHVVAIGRERMPEDLELAAVSLPANAAPGSSVTANVSIRHDRSGETRLVVHDGPALLASVPVSLGGGSTTVASVEIAASEPGFRDLSFSVEPFDDERELRNNLRRRILEVPERRFRVLYYEGEPRWEYKFLRRALVSDANLDLVSLLRASPNKFYRQGVESPEQLADGFPAERETLFAFDALIIGSVEAASFSPAQQRLIREFVSERGGSLLMLAGRSGLGNGDWGASGVGDVLPARLPDPSAGGFRRRQAPAVLTPAGRDSALLRLAPDAAESERLWASMPPLADYQDIGPLKPAARALLNVRGAEGEQPLLVTQPFGRGHAWLLATAGTWRWQMSAPSDDQRHETFWLQLARALTATSPAPVRIESSVERSGEVGIRAVFRDAAYRPMEGIDVSATVTGEAGIAERIVLEPDPADEAAWSGRYAAPASGRYFVEALATRAGEVAAEGRSSFRAEAGTAEYFALRRNDGLLRDIAAATGGSVVEPSELDRLTAQIRGSTSGVTEFRTLPLWNAPVLFLALLILKSVEWLARRRWGVI